MSKMMSKPMSKTWRFLSLFMLTCWLLASSPVTAQEHTSMLRYPISADPEHLNPFTATTIATATVSNNIYEGLLALDIATGQIKPWLAESWTVSDDQKTYTFKLRKGVKFHKIEGVKYQNDDREFKADDWVWAAQISQNKDEKISQHPEWLEGVVGAADFREGKADKIAGITTPDDYTIQIKIEEPNRLFLNNLGVPAVPREAYEQLGDRFARTPVGTGPFQFKEWQSDNFIELDANPDYWQKGLPKLDKIRFINVPADNTAVLQYRQNELDFLFDFPVGQRNALLAEFKPNYTERPGMNVRYFGFKMDKGFFAEHPLVRQALAHAFNRDLVWNKLMEEARFPGKLGVLPPDMPASTPSTLYDYDLDKAAKLLDQAGFPKGKGLPEFDLYVFATAKDELSLPVFQEDLRKLGVTLNIKVEDNATYWDHIEKEDVLFFLSGWSAGIPDPADVFEFLFYNGLGTTKYNNPKVNDLIKAARKETDLKKRTVLYQQVHDLIMSDSPVIVSAYSKLAWLQKPWVKGFNPGGGGTYTAPLLEVSIDESLKP